MRNKKGQFVKGEETRKRTSIEKPCDLCGTIFLVQPHRFKSGRGKFCSEKCRRVGIFTPEVLKKMSLAKKGKPAPYRQGEKCHWWKGGVTKTNIKIRMSLEYKLWRTAVFSRDNFTCIWCGQKSGDIEADHIKPFSKFPELRFAIDNGRTLCHSCHTKTDTYGGRSNKKVH